MIDLLIHNGIVITMNPERSVLEGTSIAIDGGRVVAVGPAAEAQSRHPATKTINARRKVVLPGMVDLHAHMGHSEVFENVGWVQ